jgi:hypothetical protein
MLAQPDNRVMLMIYFSTYNHYIRPDFLWIEGYG